MRGRHESFSDDWDSDDYSRRGGGAVGGDGEKEKLCGVALGRTFSLSAFRGGFGFVALEGGGACVATGDSGAAVEGETQEEGSVWSRRRGVRDGTREGERRGRISSGTRGVGRAQERWRPRQRQDRTGTDSVSIRDEGTAGCKVWPRRRGLQLDRVIRRCG